MAKLDFCVRCGCWIAANTGTMRKGADGKAEIICEECLKLEQNKVCPVKHDYKSGTLDDG